MEVVISSSIISQIATPLHCDPVCKDLFNFTSSKSSNSLSLTQVDLLFIISYEQLNSRLDTICMHEQTYAAVSEGGLHQQTLFLQ